MGTSIGTDLSNCRLDDFTCLGAVGTLHFVALDLIVHQIQSHEEGADTALRARDHRRAIMDKRSDGRRMAVQRPSDESPGTVDRRSGLRYW